MQNERGPSDKIGVIMKWVASIAVSLLVIFYLYATSRNTSDLVEQTKEEIKDR